MISFDFCCDSRLLLESIVRTDNTRQLSGQHHTLGLSLILKMGMGFSTLVFLLTPGYANAHSPTSAIT